MKYGDFEYTVELESIQTFDRASGQFYVAHFSNGFNYEFELRSHAPIFKGFLPGQRYRLTFRDETKADRSRENG